LEYNLYILDRRGLNRVQFQPTFIMLPQYLVEDDI